jgi:methyl-accepting chemotaxis protein
MSHGVSCILLCSSLFAFLLSSWLQKFISVPILSLAKTAKAVSREKDYSIRAPKETEGELGELAYNTTLRAKAILVSGPTGTKVIGSVAFM